MDSGDFQDSLSPVDMVLSYVSRVLMEDDTEDELLSQDTDHPALLQVKEPFAQILFSHSTSSNSDNTINRSNMEVDNNSLQGCSGGQCTLSSVFLENIEEASRFLPSDNGFRKDQQLIQMSNHRYNMDDKLEEEEVCRASKGIARREDQLEEMFDKMMQRGFETCIEDMEKLRISKGDEAMNSKKGSSKAKSGVVDLCGLLMRCAQAIAAGSVMAAQELLKQIKQHASATGDATQPKTEEEAAAREMLDRLMLNGYDPSLADMQDSYVVLRMGKTPQRGRHTVDLHTLLIRCAEAVATNDHRGAADLLERIKHHSSPTGDGMHRLAHCFAMGLEARLAGTGSQIYGLFMAKRSSTVGVLKAYQLHMASCCFLPVQHLFSNKTIYSTVAGRKKLHIVHYGLGRGLQWPDLLQWLARRDGGPPEVRLTGIDNPQPGFRPDQHIEETGHRLSECARQIGVPFRFRGIAKKFEAVQVEDLDIDPDEVLVVNSMLSLQTLMDESVFVERPNPRDMVLRTIRKMRPSVFIHTVNNGSHSSAFFMTRFREALQSYAALFDMMDTIAPRDDDKRLLVERDMFAACVTNITACEGMDRVQRPQSYRQWQKRSQRAGLRQLPLDPEIVQVLKDKVKKEYHKSFVINEDQHWLLQGWKGRVLYALSVWTADDDRSVSAQI